MELACTSMIDVSGENNNVLPLVSVLMTCYNRAKFVAEAIESVLATSYTNLELIIVDDASIDDTYTICMQYAAANPQIKVYKNENNIGDYPNRNKSAGLANGKYLVTVDSDDWMIGDNLTKWVNEMEKKGAMFGIHAPIKEPSPVYMPSRQVLFHHFFISPLLINGPIATIINKKYFVDINGFPEKYGPANDRYYNLKAASMTEVMLFPYPLVTYRLHDNQESKNKYAYLFNNYRYLNDAIKELYFHFSETQKNYILKKNKRRFLYNIVKYSLQTANVVKAYRAIKLANFTLYDSFIAVFQKSAKNYQH